MHTDQRIALALIGLVLAWILIDLLIATRHAQADARSAAMRRHPAGGRRNGLH